MPYIKHEQRVKLESLIQSFKDKMYMDPLSAGELNYIITQISLAFLQNVSYTELNEVVGILECVKQEFYRRVVAEYEDEKIQENGDVY